MLKSVENCKELRWQQRGQKVVTGAVKWKPLLSEKESQKHKEIEDRQLRVVGERTWKSKAEQIIWGGGGEDTVCGLASYISSKEKFWSISNLESSNINLCFISTKLCK